MAANSDGTFIWTRLTGTAVLSVIRPFLLPAGLAAILALGAYVYWLQGKAAQVDTLRTELRIERERHARDLAALAAERAATDRRDAIVTSGREAIIAAPAMDDGPVAPVLERALRAADEIGGIR